MLAPMMSIGHPLIYIPSKEEGTLLGRGLWVGLLLHRAVQQGLKRIFHGLNVLLESLKLLLYGQRARLVALVCQGPALCGMRLMLLVCVVRDLRTGGSV